MIEQINGNRYNFELSFDETQKEVLFIIRAICKSSGRYSSINNLNAVLTWFGIETVSPKYEDSTWIITRSEALKFFKGIKHFLGSSYFLSYLENKLDEDRVYGEWENVAERVSKSCH